MKENYTHVSFLVDRSGSMISIKEDSQGGINNLIKEQSELDGDITVTIYDFDTEYQRVFGPVPATDAPEYILSPRGGTALNDSLYKAIADTGEFLAGLDESERPDKVIFVVVTDGEENSSNEVTLEQVKESITRQTNVYNWEFVYLGADVDIQTVKRNYNFGTTVYYTRSAASASGGYGALSSAMTAARTVGSTMHSAMPDEIDPDGNSVTYTENSV